MNIEDTINDTVSLSIDVSYNSENMHPFLSPNAGQGPRNLGQNYHNSGKGCLFRRMLIFGIICDLKNIQYLYA